jgi:murein DD-endopeptidase MepM/ murein hydrolase activator NlpD
MSIFRISSFLFLCAVFAGCRSSDTVTAQKDRPANAHGQVVSDSFAYPIGKTETVTQAKDGDEWYNAQDFGKNDHLGEDWNKNTGGNTDCGEPVYAAANGVINFAQDAGPGWGNVVIIDHALASGEKIQSLYGHLQEMVKTSGEVKKRDPIGKVGNANGRYPCHLHFEMRKGNCPVWGQAGGGYSSERAGWVDPSDFIDSLSRPR